MSAALDDRLIATTTYSDEARGLAIEVALRRSQDGTLCLDWELIKGSGHQDSQDYMWECFRSFCKEQSTTERIYMTFSVAEPRVWEGGEFRRAAIRDVDPVAGAYESMDVVRLWVQGFTETELLDYLDNVATEWPKEDVLYVWKMLNDRANWRCGINPDEAPSLPKQD